MNLRQILQKIKLAAVPTIGHLSAMIDAFATKDELTKAISNIVQGSGSGGTGPAGSTGPAGADGKTVLNGSGAPSSGLGTDGDFYINTSANTIYGPKTSGSWGSPTSLIGPTGSTGSTGATGNGISSSYYNSTTGILTITYTSGVTFSTGDLRGATGGTGATGSDGKTVLNGSGAPSSGLGVNGDFYIDTTANTIYGPKASGAWGSATSIVGPTGAAGPGLPAGGTIGQIPRKNSSTNYDVSWVANTGGTIAAQFLKNLSATTLTGVAVETRFVSIFIPANTFFAGSAFEVTFRFGRNSITGSCGFKMYVNTSDAVGGSNIGAFVTGAGNISATVQRLVTIRSLTETHHYTLAGGNSSDYLIVGTGVVSSNINWAVDQYLVISLTPAASGQLHTHFSTIITPR